MADDRTRTKTLWTETMLEILYVAMKKGSPDARILEIVRDLAAKKFKAPYLVEKVRDVVGPAEAQRLEQIIKSRGKRS